MTRRYIPVCLFLAVILQGFVSSLAGQTVGRNHEQHPLALLFDDYYQRPGPVSFAPGVAQQADDQKLTNRYLPDATAIPNGTFVFSRLIARDYRVKISHAPISAELLRTADAYMMVCPIRPANGGRAAITVKEADVLESFVADGGILILVFNSVAGPADEDIDLQGINLIAHRFGLRFAAKVTETLLIPIARDNPVFSGPSNMIYGNGTIIENEGGRAAGATVLLASCNPKVPGPVAVRVRYKKGTLLALGDGGTLGNAHSLRTETDQAEVLRQMMHSLLPEGPMPEYGWHSGLRLKVKLRHQQIVSGYPDELRLFDLPRDRSNAYVEARVTTLDRQSAPGVKEAQPTVERGFGCAVAEWRAQAVLSITQPDGPAFDAVWSDDGGQDIHCRVTPRGDFIDVGPEATALASWRWALTSAVVLSPLDPVAQVGDEWRRKIMMPLPHAQLAQAPRLREGIGTYTFEGSEDYNGKACFVFSMTSDSLALELMPQDLVDPAYADYFNQRAIRFTSGAQLIYVKTWIDQTSRLPVKTEFKSSSSFWWSDEKQPDFFISSHTTKRIYEDVKETRHVVTFGRLLTAEFETE
jgi:hypothetical protein